MKIVAVSGSLRAESFNTRIARLMAEQAPRGVELQIQTLHGIPLYDGDLEEKEGIPAAVESLRHAIKSADGLILVTPEYNAGMPGVLKNALDWLTRPGEEMKPTFGGRKTALAGATPGAWGTSLAQSGALINLRQLGVHLYPGYLRVSKVHENLDGAEAEEKLKEQIRKWLAGFTDFIGQSE